MMPHKPTDRPENRDQNADRAALERAATYDTGEVVVGPWVRPEGTEVVDGELVETARPTYNTRRITVPHVPDEVRQRFADAAVAGTRASAPVIKRAGRGVYRHARYLGCGIADVWHAGVDRATHRDLTEAIKAARAAGDHQAVRELEATKAQVATSRVERVKLLAETLWKLAKAGMLGTACVGAVWTAVTLGHVGTGLYQQFDDGEGGFAEVWDPWWDWNTSVVTGIGDALDIAADVAPWALGALGAAAVVRLHHRGRDAATSSGADWAVTGAEPVDDTPRVLVTADGIVRALQHLAIPALTRAFKEGWTPTFALIPTREGEGQFKGYRAVFDLPMGVTPAMLSDKRDVLARNLNRNPIEVWPADDGQKRGGRPGFVDLYVADAGVMDKPTPAYPLLTDGTADVFRGVPIGITQRGEQVRMPLVASNFVIGGLPGQGKSNAMRVIMLGAALDPLAELRVHVFAANGDFDVYAPRLSRYVKGASAEHAEAATEHLRELHAEIARREGRLAEVGAKKLTRAISAKHPDLRPLVVAFSECHELFGDDEVGEEAAELATDVIKRGRKTGVIVGFDTQSARAGAMPPKVVENVGVNCCFYVKTWRNNDGFLGDGSFAAGIRATELRFNVDRGTMMTTGITDEQFELLRTHFIEVDDDRGWDAAEDVIRRSMEIVDPATPVQGSRPQRVVDAEESRDLLADVVEVLRGEAKVKTVDVAARLRELAPGYRPYKGLDGAGVKKALTAEGVRVTMSDGYDMVRPERVAEAIAKRSSAQE